MATQNAFHSAADGATSVSKPAVRYSSLPPCQRTSCLCPHNPPNLAISLVGPNTVLTFGTGRLLRNFCRFASRGAAPTSRRLQRDGLLHSRPSRQTARLRSIALQYLPCEWPHSGLGD